MTKYACGLPSCRPVRLLLLPSRLAPCHLPQRGRLWFYAQSKLVSLREPRSRSDFFALTHNPTCLSLWERCRAATERADAGYILSPVCPDTNWLAFTLPLSTLISPAHIPLLFSARCGIFPCSRQCRTRRPAARRRPPPVQIGW